MNKPLPPPDQAYEYFLGLNTPAGHTYTRDEVEGLLAEFLRGLPGSVEAFTSLNATGWWEGTREPSLLIYVSGLPGDGHTRLLEWLRTRFSQQCIGYRPAQVLQLHWGSRGAGVGGALHAPATQGA